MSIFEDAVMGIAMICESCGASLKVDEAHAGKRARCRHCGYVFRIPRPGEAPEPNEYALAEPIAQVSPTVVESVSFPRTQSTFVPAPRDGNHVARKPRPRKRSSTRPQAEPKNSGINWISWLVKGGLVAVGVLIALAVLVPGGLVASGTVLLALGLGMVTLGWGVGAYAAFCEDFLYGFLYVACPIYTGYYLVTRWDDLWPWFACSTVGVGVLTVGRWVIELSGSG